MVRLKVEIKYRNIDLNRRLYFTLKHHMSYEKVLKKVKITVLLFLNVITMMSVVVMT